MLQSKLLRRKRIHHKIRAKISGSIDRPRLVVFRSIKYNYAQLIDDHNGKILGSSHDLKSKTKNKSARAKQVGLDIAKKAIEKNINQVVFDRNGFTYHGRIRLIADGAREGGLKF